MNEKWQGRFLNIASEISTWSKDTSSKVGCVIVDDQLSIKATGYNGIPRNVDDSKEERQERPAKYMWYNHAEANAIANCARLGISTNECTMLITHPPCSACTRNIIQAGIKEVVIDSSFLSTSDFMTRWSEEFETAKQLLSEANVTLTIK